MKTLKAITGLLLAPVAILLVEFGVTLLPCDRHYQLRRMVYAGAADDARTLFGIRE